MTTDRDGNRSNPYKPNPELCCERCAFGRGDHAKFCSQYLEVEYFPRPVSPFPRPFPWATNGYLILNVSPIELDNTVNALQKLAIHGDGF